MAYDPDLRAHLEWLGYLQPVGLVVSPHALLQAQAILNRNILPDHRRFLEHVLSAPLAQGEDPAPLITDFPAFAHGVLGWEPADLLGTTEGGALPDDLPVALPDYEEVLRPTYAVREFQGNAPVDFRRGGPLRPPAAEQGPSREGTEPLPYGSNYLLLIQILPAGTDLDSHDDGAEAHRWHASPQAKFERLLREKQVPIGLLGNGTHLRLVYAPRGETSGHVTFPVKAMTEVAGRPIFAALHLLLSSERLFSLPARQRLPALLSDSRKYQNVVSTKLAGQVLSALYELVRGFQAADDLRHGEVLREVLAEDPNQVYAGLLTVLLRSVFVLYAEDRGLLPSDTIYRDHYSVSGLFEQLRADAGCHPDTMDQRYGAWARLLTLYRLLHDGAAHGSLRIPARHGHLFDPERYPFLEGRLKGQPLLPGHTLPLVSDGVVYRVLDNLLVLDGERLSYRSLDVEQIGSVYEAMMGFRLEVARGRAIGVKSKKKHGAPATLDLDALLALAPSQRGKFLMDETEQAVSGQALKALQDAKTPEDAVQALGKKVATEATPNIVPAGAMILQPSEERRRSGSHYTPRSLTEPIVRTTLRPILERLGANPTPDQILSLKVCDMAMGSGAFLVEADRQLGDALVKAWYAHKCLPKVPPDEDEVLHARRLVAQRCLYGVDKNPLAVDLAKLSLWLATLARNHAFTFLDHALRHGDSLVGLTKKQITAFHWDPGAQRTFAESLVEERVKKVAELRRAIQLAEDEAQNAELTALLSEADRALADVRLIGDLAIAAFFEGKNDKERKAKREEYLSRLTAYLSPVGAAPPGRCPGQASPRTGDPDGGTGALACTHQAPSPRTGEHNVGAAPRRDSSYRAGGGAPTQEIVEAVHDLKVGLAPHGELVSSVGAGLCPRPREGAEALPYEKHPIHPFHWEIEFPEVFGRENPGFDAIVGNPPFLGGKMISGAYSFHFLDWLKFITSSVGGQSDLVAYFFRRGFVLLKDGGTFGLIATNTVSQGDTRTSGLVPIRNNGGDIYLVKRRLKWPGQAAVMVSVIHIMKGHYGSPKYLDEKPVDQITAFLLSFGPDENPIMLNANTGICFKGIMIGSEGFLFEDGNEKAGSLAEMKHFVSNYPACAGQIIPFIRGDEILDHPQQLHSRFVADFYDIPETKLATLEPLTKVVKERVQQDRRGGRLAALPWWAFERPRPAMREAIKNIEHVLVHPYVSSNLAFAKLPATTAVSTPSCLFATSSNGLFCLLQCRTHEVWVRMSASTLKDDLRYTPSDCFETFPFPRNFDTNATLEQVGREYYEFRAALMVKNNEGLTKTYNRFHDPDHDGMGVEGRTPSEVVRDIETLRTRHNAMDRAVLDAYGWTDIRPTCQFLLDYEEEEDDDDVDSFSSSHPSSFILHPTSKRRKRRPWRYRWPDDIRDEVLARLLALNAQRAEEERLQSLQQAADAPATYKKPRRGKKAKESTTRLPIGSE